MSRGPRTDLGSITISQNREEGWEGGSHSPEEWLVGTQGEGMCPSLIPRAAGSCWGSRGWTADGTGRSCEWEVRRWRPALPKVSLQQTGERAELAGSGVLASLPAAVTGMGKEGALHCAGTIYVHSDLPQVGVWLLCICSAPCESLLRKEAWMREMRDPGPTPTCTLFSNLLKLPRFS